MYHSIKFQNNSLLTPIPSPKDKCIGIYDKKNNNTTFLYTYNLKFPSLETICQIVLHSY